MLGLGGFHIGLQPILRSRCDWVPASRKEPWDP